VEDGSFRSDLYHRLNTISIRIPPLRERLDELPFLISQIRDKIRSRKPESHVPYLYAEMIQALMEYHWPGNVRELENLIERVAVFGTEEIENMQLSDEPLEKATTDTSESGRERDLKTGPNEWSWSTEFPKSGSWKNLQKDLKRALIEEALRRSDGKIAEAARLLGMRRDVLSRYVNKRQ
jgi:DNA-binding NtrC family response regulator